MKHEFNWWANKFVFFYMLHGSNGFSVWALSKLFIHRNPRVKIEFFILLLDFSSFFSLDTIPEFNVISVVSGNVVYMGLYIILLGCDSQGGPQRRWRERSQCWKVFRILLRILPADHSARSDSVPYSFSVCTGCFKKNVP